jgi:hypothetical protein
MFHHHHQQQQQQKQNITTKKNLVRQPHDSTSATMTTKMKASYLEDISN